MGRLEDLQVTITEEPDSPEIEIELMNMDNPIRLQVFFNLDEPSETISHLSKQQFRQLQIIMPLRWASLPRNIFGGDRRDLLVLILDLGRLYVSAK